MNKLILYLTCSLLFLSATVMAQQPTYVFVHGAWGGAWQFKKTAEQLTQQGANVYRVNLTGLGDRYHLASPEVNLSTHITDVVNAIMFEGLDSVILVGHSYGGMVITGVADSIPGKIKKMIYLDAFLPEDGESVAFYLQGNPDADLLQSEDGLYVKPSWVKDTTKFPRDVPHPIATLKEKIKLDNTERLKIPTTYILTYESALGGKEKDPFYFFSTRAQKHNFQVVGMEADHNPQIKHLKELVQILLTAK